jgi:hypothetical protein
MQRAKKFPDRRSDVRNEGVDRIRLRLRACVDTRTHPTEEGDAGRVHLDGVADGCRSPRVVVQVAAWLNGPIQGGALHPGRTWP